MSRESFRSVASMSATLSPRAFETTFPQQKWALLRPFRQALKCGERRIAPPRRKSRVDSRELSRATSVTGPSLTSSTLIRAPNTPVATGTPCDASVVQKRSKSALARSWRRSAREARAIPARRIGDERELADDERLATDVDDRAVEPPSSFSKTRSRANLTASASASSRHPRRRRRPGSGARVRPPRRSPHRP